MNVNNEERKRQGIAALISLGISGLIFLFFILYKIITPNPPFEFAGEGGIEVNFGTYNEGTGDVENTGIGTATSVVTESSATKTDASANKEKVYTSDNGEAVDVKKDENKPKMENNNTVITPVKTTTTAPKEKSNNNSLLNAYTKNAGKSGGGDGNSGNAGNDGQPDGNLNTHGLGGTGGGQGNTDGGGGIGGFSLAGRKIVIPPSKVYDSREEGTVVVIIKVDKQGNITSADANGRGTNTSSAVLKSKARNAALSAKFNPSDKYEEQEGTMIFKFEF